MSKVEDFLTKKQEQEIVTAIQKAEMHTSGEIRVHLESSTDKKTLDRATEIFFQLKMNETKHKNGVLFYLAIEDKKFALIGDENINHKVTPNFWKEITSNILNDFKKQHFTAGLTNGILQVGKELQQYFPYDKSTDKNELSDAVSIG